MGEPQEQPRKCGTRIHQSAVEVYSNITSLPDGFASPPRHITFVGRPLQHLIPLRLHASCNIWVTRNVNLANVSETLEQTTSIILLLEPRAFCIRCFWSQRLKRSTGARGMCPISMCNQNSSVVSPSADSRTQRFIFSEKTFSSSLNTSSLPSPIRSAFQQRGSTIACTYACTSFSRQASTPQKNVSSATGPLKVVVTTVWKHAGCSPVRISLSTCPPCLVTNSWYNLQAFPVCSTPRNWCWTLNTEGFE